MAPRRSDPRVDLALFHETIRDRLQTFVGDKTQLDIALQFGMYPGTLSRWVNGTDAPRAHNLAVVAFKGRISLDWLFGFTPIEGPMRPRSPFIDPGYFSPGPSIPEED